MYFVSDDSTIFSSHEREERTNLSPTKPLAKLDRRAVRLPDLRLDNLISRRY